MRKKSCTLLLYLSDLFHSFLQNCTFVRLDVEVVNVIEVGEDQLGELLDVFVLVLAVALLVAPLWTAETKRLLGEEREVQVWGSGCMFYYHISLMGRREGQG